MAAYIAGRHFLRAIKCLLGREVFFFSGCFPSFISSSAIFSPHFRHKLHNFGKELSCGGHQLLLGNLTVASLLLFKDCFALLPIVSIQQANILLWNVALNGRRYCTNLQFEEQPGTDPFISLHRHQSLDLLYTLDCFQVTSALNSDWIVLDFRMQQFPRAGSNPLASFQSP